MSEPVESFGPIAAVTAGISAATRLQVRSDAEKPRPMGVIRSLNDRPQYICCCLLLLVDGGRARDRDGHQRSPSFLADCLVWFDVRFRVLGLSVVYRTRQIQIGTLGLIPWSPLARLPQHRLGTHWWGP